VSTLLVFTEPKHVLICLLKLEMKLPMSRHFTLHLLYLKTHNKLITILSLECCEEENLDDESLAKLLNDLKSTLTKKFIEEIYNDLKNL